MSAVFIQTRNGTISIIRDLTPDVAEKVVDTALDGPRHREEARRLASEYDERCRIANIFFSGNPHVQQITFARVGEVRRRDGSASWFGVSASHSSWRYCQDSDIVRAEII